MIIALESNNLLASATILSNASAFERAFGAANGTTDDLHQLVVWRGTFTVDATNNKIDGNDGAGFVTTLNSGTYYTPADMAIEVARALNAASTLWQCWVSQGSTSRYRFVIYRTAGTGAFAVNSGGNASVNSMRLLLGFRNEDRAAAATHTGDYAAIGGAYQSVVYDLGSAKNANVAAVINPQCSPAATWEIGAGATSACTDATYYFADAHDTELLCLRLTSFAYRYVEVRCRDPRRTDAGATGFGYVYLGSGFDTDDASDVDRVEWEAGGYARSLSMRASIVPSIVGPQHVSELAPGESFSVSFAGSPGLASSMLPQMIGAFDALGNNVYALVSLMSSEPNRESAWCRVPSPPAFTRGDGMNGGRWKMAVTFEKAFIR